MWDPIMHGVITNPLFILQGRCQRDFCKYYHPPNHIKERLISSGKQFGAMFAAKMSNNPTTLVQVSTYT